MIFSQHSLNYIESPSGKFFINNEGIALDFEPSKENKFIIEDIEYREYYCYRTYKSIRTFIVPEGVKGFVSNFMRNTRVVEKFELPNSLLSIGNNLFGVEHEMHAVFADCILPSVIIPKNVQEIGGFAFGHSHIQSLKLPSSLRSPYGRQFKDSFIDTVFLPSEWNYMNFYVDRNSGLRFENMHDGFGFLGWPSTKVKKIIFY